jgi:hypothetical protein
MKGRLAAHLDVTGAECWGIYLGKLMRRTRLIMTKTEEITLCFNIVRVTYIYVQAEPVLPILTAQALFTISYIPLLHLQPHHKFSTVPTQEAAYSCSRLTNAGFGRLRQAD